MRKSSGQQRNSPSDWEGKNARWVNWRPYLFGLAPIVGHVGDGNFHCVLPLDLECEEEMRKAKEFVDRLSRYVIGLR